MRLMLLSTKTGLTPCIHRDKYAVPVHQPPASWPELIETLHEQRAVTVDESKIIPLSIARYAPPASPENKILCTGLNYRDHAEEGKQPIPDFPVFFVRYLSSFTGHNTPLVATRLSDKYDYEAELAVVIGRRMRHVPEEQALGHVFGYTMAMDGSVRDYQKRSVQWTLGKNFDLSGALGPEIVTADELPPGAHGLSVQARINGELLQNGNTAECIFSVAKLLSTLSSVMTLNPGDVVLTGTPAGVGFARTPPVYLKPGDTVEVSVEGLGTLKNSVMGE